MERRIKRREALKMIRNGLGLAVLTAAGAVSLDINELSYEKKLQYNVPGLVGAYPFLMPYELTDQSVSLPGSGEINIAVRQPRPSHAGTLGLRLSDGNIPGLSLVDENGICVAYRTGLADEQPGETRELLQMQTPQDLLVPVTGSKELVVDGEVRRTILVGADSWARWGGAEHSVAAMLQRLLAFSGYGTLVGDISASGVSIANPLAVVDRWQRHGKPLPDAFVTSLHATDYTTDTQILSLPVDKQAEFLGTGIYQSASGFDPVREAIRWDAKRAEHVFPIIGQLRQMYRNGKGGDMRLNTDDRGIVSDAGILASLSEAGKPLFETYLSLVRAFSQRIAGKAQVMMVLPDNLAAGASVRFREEVVAPVAHASQSANHGFRYFENHDFPPDRYDAFDHPTAAGSLWLAQRVFASLTQQAPSDTANQLAWDHYRGVHESLAPFRSKLLSVAA